MKVVDKRGGGSGETPDGLNTEQTAAHLDAIRTQAEGRGFIADGELTPLGQYRVALEAVVSNYRSGRGYRRTVEAVQKFLRLQDAQ